MGDLRDALHPDARAACERLVHGLADLVVDVLAAAALDEPICWVCLSPGQEEGMDNLPIVYAGRESDRRRVVDEGLEHWSSLWNPYCLRDERDVVHPTEDDGWDRYVETGAGLRAAWDVVREAIDGRVLDPEYWVFEEVARELNHRPLPLPGTEDLAVWVFSFDASDGDLLGQLERVLRPATFAALRTQGLLSTTPEAVDSAYLASNLAAPDPCAALRRAAASDEPPSFRRDAERGLGYLALIPGAELADRNLIGTEDESLDLSLEYDGRGRLAGVGFEDAVRHAPPELLSGTGPLGVRSGARGRPGTTLVLAERADDDIADRLEFSDDVTGEGWVTLDLDRSGHLVAIHFHERHTVPPGLRVL